MGEDWYRMQGIEVRETDRGGRVTYHGPGQLVGYPIVDLRAYGDDVHEYIRRMERVMIAALADFGVAAGPIEGLTGVWTEGARPGEDPGGREARKIGSIGVHVNRGDHDPRLRDQRQQRPAAVRVGRPLRDRGAAA